LANGGSSQEITALFPYMKGFILDRNRQLASEYGLFRFRRGMLAIDEAERAAKNGISDHDLLMEILLTQLSL
jgi:DNA polymerase-3 subunit delta